MGGIMVGDSLNLADMVSRNFTGDFVRRISAFLGESREKTQAGINAGVPGILSAMGAAAQASDGENRLISAVDDADEGITSRPGAVFGTGTSSDDIGLIKLRSIIGGGALSDLG